VQAARSAPSPFFLAWHGELREAAKRGPVLDLACGEGRHALATAALGARAVALDRDAAALAALARRAFREALPALPVRADLETGLGLPFRERSFGAILVFCYLWRPLAPALAAALRPGGLLLYETFTLHQRELGYGPRNPAFLLEERELPRLFPELEVLHYEEGLRSQGRPAHLASLAARR
jgi:SAM-dependent methyltransferase